MTGSSPVLLACELGAGTGHVMSLARLARRLMADGVSVIMAAPGGSEVHPGLQDIAMIPAPAWPRKSRAEWTGSAAYASSLAGNLAWRGLADPAATAGILTGWIGILASLKPSLVVTDFAPLCALAARDKAPLVQTGIGYVLPPSHLSVLPVLRQTNAPPVAQEQLTHDINEALRRVDLPPIGHLGELFTADDVVVTTFPLFDPYAEWRQEPAAGPLLDRLPVPRQPGTERVFAYLPQDILARPDIKGLLGTLSDRLHIYSGDSDDRWRETMTSGGATVYDAMPPLAHLLAGCRLVIHQGGAGLAAEALLAGVPQLILARHVEQVLNGEALERAGCGRVLHLYDPSVTIAASDIEPHAGQDRNAERLADEHRRLMTPDPLERLAATCHSLMGEG